jgi:uridine kinase
MFCIAICGGSGSGKSSVLQCMINLRPNTNIALLPMDAYYKDHSHLSPQQKKECNFDHPDAIDFELLEYHIQCLRNGQPVQRPVYSFISCSRQKETIPIHPADYIFIEGLFALYRETLYKMADISMFLDGAEDVRLDRIIYRDMHERNRSREETLERYINMVAPMYIQYIEPTRKHADFTIDTSNNDISYIASLIWKEIDRFLALKL